MDQNKDYSFRQIENFASEEGYLLNELGGETIGKSFIVLDHYVRDETISFILTGYNSVQGNIYTCIYSDKRSKPVAYRTKNGR
jgi:hypothetical protein